MTDIQALVILTAFTISCLLIVLAIYWLMTKD